MEKSHLCLLPEGESVYVLCAEAARIYESAGQAAGESRWYIMALDEYMLADMVSGLCQPHSHVQCST